jgi:zinc transport system substrate-binding protein
MKMVFMTVSRRLLRAGLGVLALVLVAGCGNLAAGGSKSGRLTVVTAFYPLQFIAQQVAGPHAEVLNLTRPGAEPHDLELTPRQVASVTDADLVVYEKSFQAAVDEAVQQSENDHVLDTGTVVPLEDHGPLGEDEHGVDPSGDDHRDGGLDPHVWLDPHNMVTITRAVADRLQGVNPGHAADYRRNARRLIDRLDDLDAAYRSGLQQCRRKQFVTSHAAFGYLAERYGLIQISVSGLSPETEPSPARIAEVQQQVRDDHVTTIFYETLASPAVATSIARDLGLATDVLDPIEGITEQSRGRDYLTVMRSNLTALEKANGCEGGAR